jgi:hypothetical protein
MRKTFVAVLLVLVAAAAAFANGNAEKLTEIEGTVVQVESLNTRAQVMLRMAGGEEVVVEMPLQEMLRLQIRAEQQVRVSGVYVGVPAGAQVRARILARTMNASGTESAISSPVRLTTRDREQIRAYEQEQLKLQTQLQTQSQEQDRDGEGSPSGSGNAGSTAGK